MNVTHKVISHLPVDELWAGPRLVSTIKIRYLDEAAIVDLLHADVVRFVVADVGQPCEWIPNNERYDFWKYEVKPHLAAPQAKVFLEDFPDEYCYFATEWKSYEGGTIVLLTKAH